MMHFWLIAVVVLLPVSVLLLTTLHRISRYYPHNYLRPLFFSFLATTIYFFMNFFPMYVRANFPSVWQSLIQTSLGYTVYIIYSTLLQVLIVAGTLFFVRTIRLVSIRSSGRWAEWILLALISVMVFCRLVTFFAPQLVRLSDCSLFVTEYIFQFQSLLPLILLLLLLGEPIKGDGHKSPCIIRPFALIFIIRETAVLLYELAVKAVELNGIVLPDAVKVIGDVAFMGVNILALFVFVRRFLVPELDRTKTGEGLERMMSVLAHRFRLTDREVAIACLVLEGKSNKEIAVALKVSVSTVKNHIYNTYQKLDINSRFELFEKVRQNEK